ncbi:hypothetical protein GCM10027082_25250 [Comamonas humi]
MQPPSTPARICNIDLLRGLVAVSVLIWHYQHFYYPTAEGLPVDWEPSQQPWFAWLEWAYSYGGLWRVQWFWLLSGFTFFHIYGQRRDIAVRVFLGQRFARLYPLHFATLCLVAALQVASQQWLGHFQIYPANDAYHFTLHVFFASAWGLQTGFSFNYPVWSLSVELLVLGLFLVYLRNVRVTLASSLAWLVAAWVCSRLAPIDLFLCMVMFTLGGVVQQWNQGFVQRWGPGLNLAAAALASCIAVAALASDQLPVSAVLQRMLLPALTWLAAALEQSRISVGRWGTGLGNLSYASYLIHIPVQLVALLVLDGVVGSRAAVDSGWFLLGFIAVVMGLAWPIYHGFERPLQLLLRRKLEPRPASADQAD